MTYLIIWVLCSLTTFLLVSMHARSVDSPLEVWSLVEWLWVLVCSVLFPIGLCFLFVQVVWPALIKERRLKKQ